MPRTPNPTGSWWDLYPEPNNFVYPEPPDVLSEYPILAKVLMERITSHRHPGIDRMIEAERTRLAAIDRTFQKVRNRKYAVPRSQEVSQNGDPKKGPLGFQFKEDKTTGIPVPDPRKTVVSVVSADRCFCQWNDNTDRWIVYQVEATVPAKGGPPFKVESTNYTVVYFTWDTVRDGELPTGDYD